MILVPYLQLALLRHHTKGPLRKNQIPHSCRMKSSVQLSSVSILYWNDTRGTKSGSTARETLNLPLQPKNAVDLVPRGTKRLHKRFRRHATIRPVPENAGSPQGLSCRRAPYVSPNKLVPRPKAPCAEQMNRMPPKSTPKYQPSASTPIK